MNLTLENCNLLLDGEPLLSGMAAGVIAEPDPSGLGLFLRFAAEKPADRLVFALGDLSVARFTACHRYEPFWMKPAAGVRGGEAPVETQYLLAELASGPCVLMVPLVDGVFRAALEGAGEDGLALVAETGDPATVGAEVTGLYVAAGEDPFSLLEAAAPFAMARMGTGRLRSEKPAPEFMDRFGWCTWDAFYHEVSGEKVREGLQSFADGGVLPRLLILDDGWQSVRAMASGERRLTAFEADAARFEGGLAPLIRAAKEEFGVESFVVWHAITGYWGGVDGEALPGYGVRGVERRFSPGILHHSPTIAEWWGKIVGLVPPESVYRFFQDYHRYLREQGVDGVKVDTQATLEGVAHGSGGRVALMRSYHEALEGSAHVHFRGELINCMSCANEMFYGALNSNLTRTSTDFWPNRPESHGLHLYTNAQVSAWFGEFTWADWDMFQSGHPMGAYHAAGRSVGGCPVYVSDKPDAHNFDLLRKLVLPDGSVLRCLRPGRPTRDCLFHDVTREPVLLKIQNVNLFGGIVGAFNARYGGEGQETAPIAGAVRPSDVVGLDGERFAVYAHNARELRVLGREDAWEIKLPQLACELFTIAPIEEGIAAIGLADLFNSGGAVYAVEMGDAGDCTIVLQSGGRFLAWCERAPRQALVNGDATPFHHDAATGALEVEVPGSDPAAVTLLF